MKQKVIEQIGKAIIPKTFRPGLRLFFAKAGIKKVPYKTFGVLLYVLLAIVGLIYVLTNFYGSIAHLHPLLVGLSVFAFWIIVGGLITLIVIGAVYFYLNLKIFNRIKEMDLNLADYLVLVSTNLKGGLSFEKSLWSAIKPEFGVLAEEMGLVSKKVMTGSGLSESLQEFANKYESPSIKRTMDLIIGQIESGGEVASVLDETIDTLRKTKMLKEEMAANTLMFTIFIGAIVTVISPLLFALALNLLGILVGVSATVAPALEASHMDIPFELDELSIDIEEFQIFSVLALSVISLFASLILSIIQKGDVLSGIKYVPLFLFVSITLYFIFMSVLGGMLTFI